MVLSYMRSSLLRFVALVALSVPFLVVFIQVYTAARPALVSLRALVATRSAAVTVPARQMNIAAPASFSGSCFDLARVEAVQQGINADLYIRQIQQESGCQPDICSSVGACGVAQLMPGTAAGLGVNPMDMQQSLWAGAHLMAGYLHTFGGDWAKALACYNAGSGATAYVVSMYGASWYAYLPQETQHYILVILGHF